MNVSSRMIICEGPEDVAFVRQLIVNREIPYFTVLDTTTESSPSAGGNTRFGEKLIAIKNRRDFKALEKVVLLTDCDDDPNQTFQGIADQVNRIPESPYGRIDEPMSESDGDIKLSVYMVPNADESGNLETLCCPSARSFDTKITEQIDLFAATVYAETWGRVNRVSKFWLRVMLATCCERDPFVFMKNVFSDPRNRHLIRLDHSCFDDLSDYLSRFAQ